MFTVLPFGLSIACYLFTKLLRPLTRLMRGRGLKAIIYLDDGIVAVHGKDRATSESVLVKSNLENASFVINVEKKPMGPPPTLLNCLDLLLTCLRVSSQFQIAK